MAATARNQPCPCGSGRKTKRCCGVQRGPSTESLALAFLSHASRKATPALDHVTDARFEELFDQLADLPALDPTLLIELPEPFSPMLEEHCQVTARELALASTKQLADLLHEIDTPQQRARLAANVIALRDRGTINDQLAASALIDLSSHSRQLLYASLRQALATRTGPAKTPAGTELAA